MRKALAAVVLGSLTLIVNPASASAHADLQTSTPTNGSVMSVAPKKVVLTFSEPVELQEAQLLNSSLHIIESSSVISGSLLTITPSAKLSTGSIAAQWKVKSDDGHVISGAIAFIIGIVSKQQVTTPINTSPVMTTTLSGNRSGLLTITLASKATTGDIEWTNPALNGPITWRTSSNGKQAKATGVLPFAGSWKMTATLINKGGSVLMTTGTANLV